jgi:TPR repeat protein
MKCILRYLTIIILLSVAAAGCSDSDIGSTNPTDYAATKARAEGGSAGAQWLLGSMYRDGKGVAQNYVEAAKWYRLAAMQGEIDAQFWLGYIYLLGQGAPENNQLSYVWFSVSAARGYRDASEERDLVKKLLTPQALEQAQALATRCFESNFKDCE